MLGHFFPFLGWFRNYRLEELKGDALAGLTVALVLIPQAMAYAQLAGLPAYYGLYAALIPPMIAGLFGSCRQMTTGPAAVVSIMTAASLGHLVTHGSAAYISYAILLALLVGGFQFLLGLLKLGVVVNFLSHPVVNGFTNAAALIIASSQLPKMFGVYVEKGDHHYETMIRLIEAVKVYVHWPTFFIGLFAFAIMYALRRLNPRIPNVLVAVVLTTLISYLSGFEHDCRAPISAIVSPDTQRLIREYDAAMKQMNVLTRRLNAGTSKIIQAGKGHHPSSRAILLAKQKQFLEESERKVFLEEIRLKRRRLRELTFYGTEDVKGARRFYLKEEFPAGLPKDGRTWRLPVGEDPLDENSLLLRAGGEVLGTIPGGLPRFSLPEVDGVTIFRLLPYAAIISLFGFMQAISIAKAIASKTGQRIDPNQELIGQGLANILGAFGKGYPVAGSFAISAVNFQAGAVTGLSDVFAGLSVLVTLLFFTPLLYHLPQSVLAAIIMLVVLGLINVSGLIHAWRANWYDGAISVICFLFTLAFAPHLEKGLLVGVGLSLLVFLCKSMWPRAALLSRYLDESFHDAKAYGLNRCEHIAMLRFDGPLFFANATYLEDRIARIRTSMPFLRQIHIVASGIDEMDATGEEVLSLIVDRVRSAGYEISFSGLKKNVLDVMKRTFLFEKIGREHIFPTEAAAIDAIYGETHRQTDEKECPLINYSPITPRDLRR